MNDKSTNPALLPSGFQDLLFPDATQEARAVEGLMSGFDGFGYERVNPPLVEFEESLLARGPGVSLVNDTFRMMDPVSHRMMALRSDITAQISRIASSRLGKQPRPLRLSYAGSVLRMQGSQQRTERQFRQVGCEIIGGPDDQADIEICVLPLLGLSNLGLRGLTLDLTLPGLLAQIFEEYDVDKIVVKQALDKRDVDALQGFEPIFAQLLEAAGPGDKAISALEAVEMSAEARVHVTRLGNIYAGVKKALGELGLDGVAVSIDPTESKGFDYHNGVAFVLFAKGARAEIGRGGRYDVSFGADETPESATGFTLYMDTVRGAMPKLEDKKRVSLDFDTPWSTLLAMQDQGVITVRSATNKEDE